MITAAYLLSFLLFLSLVGAVLFFRVSTRGPRDLRALSLQLLTGSLLVGGLYLLVVVVLSPRPSPWNLIWFAGIPIVVAVGRRPRVSKLPLAVLLFLGGWVSSALVAWAFRIPLY